MHKCVNPVWWQRNSFNFRGKNREKGLGSSYYANVLMFYLEGGEKKKERKKEEAFQFSLAVVTKH